MKPTLKSLQKELAYLSELIRGMDTSLPEYEKFVERKNGVLHRIAELKHEKELSTLRG